MKAFLGCIEPLEARIAPATLVVTHSGSDGVGSLRAAILTANASPGMDTILFQIGVTSVTLTTPLPEITDQIDLDGGDMGVTIYGTLVPGTSGNPTDGLVLSGDQHTGSRIEKIRLVAFTGDGLVLANGGSNTVVDSAFGSNGSFGYANEHIAGYGLRITSSNNHVLNCTITNTGEGGILIEGVADGSTIHSNRIEDSYIGARPGASAHVYGAGVTIDQAQDTVLIRNTIDGIYGAGVVISGENASGNKLYRNQIGTWGSNSSHGVVLQDGASGNRIGAPETIQWGEVVPGGNTIANNAEAGVVVIGQNTVGNRISSNHIYGNGGLPIDLDGGGVTPNDGGFPPDSDMGPNRLQNTPVITGTLIIGGNAYITGQLRSTPNEVFLIEFFTAHGTLPADQNVPLTSRTVITNENGVVSFLVLLDPDTVAAGDLIRATATNERSNDTSEFSTESAFVSGDDLLQVRGKKVTFTDVDGDRVTVAVNRGKLAPENFVLVPSSKGVRLEALQLDSSLDGASLTITAAKAKSGDGFVNVGGILASDVNLQSIRIDGDLNHLKIGSAGVSQSLGTLTVRTMGMAAWSSEGAGFGLLPGVEVLGDVRKITVKKTVIGMDVAIGGSLQKEFTAKDGVRSSHVEAAQFGKVRLGLFDNSYIEARTGGIALVSIAGDMLGDTGGAGIYARTTIGSIAIKGDVRGSMDTTSSARIVAGGNLSPVKSADAVAIGRITIGGQVSDTDILAGYIHTEAGDFPVNGDASIGRVTVGRIWFGSNIVAGIAPGEDEQFGTADDETIPGGTEDIFSRIGRIVIKGNILPSYHPDDHYGFVAAQIGALSVKGKKVPLTAMPDDLPVGTATDLRVREVIPS